MTLTKEQIKTQIIAKLLPKYKIDLTWVQLVSAVQASNSTDKASIVEAVSGGKAQKAGLILSRLIMNELNTLAETEADTMLTDDTLSLTELDRIYG